MSDEMDRCLLPLAALDPDALAAPEPVSALRWFGTGEPAVSLAAGQARFTIGARDADVIVPPGLAAGVDRWHATLCRDGAAVRVIDAGSRCGTYRAIDEARLASFERRAGQSFWLAGARVLLLDAQLAALRAQLAARLGLGAYERVDEAVAVVASRRPLALVGPPGTGARSLAVAIHGAGAQRRRALVDEGEVLPDLGAVRGAVVLVDLDRVRRVPAPWLRGALDPARAARVLFLCDDEARLHRVLDHHRERVSTLRLVPLARRPADVLPLVARVWRDLGSDQPPDALGAGVAALEAYPWPGNLDELHAHARRLLAYLTYGGLRPAAAMLGIRHQTLAEHFRRIGFAAETWLPGVPCRARDRAAPACPITAALGLAHRTAADVWRALAVGPGPWLRGLDARAA